MIKKSYFVNVESMTISETSVPSGAEYAIIADKNDIKEIESLFMRLNEDSKQALKFLVKPFNERKVDGLREKYDDDLVSIYKKIFDIGTVETKIKIEEMGILE